MKKNLKMVIILSILLFIYISICAFSYASTTSSEIANSVFRLHVIANSNSNEDQNLKYKVRDSLLEYMNSICQNCTSKENAITIVEKHKSNFDALNCLASILEYFNPTVVHPMPKLYVPPANNIFLSDISLFILIYESSGYSISSLETSPHNGPSIISSYSELSTVCF